MSTEIKPTQLLTEKPQTKDQSRNISSSALKRNEWELQKGLFDREEKNCELFKTLTEEVETLLKKGLPRHVKKISKPYIPTHQLDSQMYMKPSTEIPLKQQVVQIELWLQPQSPDERFPLYRHGIRATLQFDNKYIDDLNRLPRVWFQTTMSHPLVSRFDLSNWNRMFWTWFSKSNITGKAKVTIISVLEYLNIYLFLFKKDTPLKKLPSKYRRQLHFDAVVDAYQQHRVHQELFETPWPDEFFNPDFLKHFREGSIKDIVKEIYQEVFTFPIFSEKLCSAITTEMLNYQKSGLPVQRPNSMNNYGLILNDIGLEPSLKWLQENYLWQVARALFRHSSITSKFDSHHSFIVHYEPGKDLGLDMHTDDSDITFNVCLGKEFQGAALNFCGIVGQPDHRQFKTAYHHIKGNCIVHLGAQRHGACSITSGERFNLIMWNKNHTWRKSKDLMDLHATYSKEQAAPDVRCLSYTHDKDYIFFMKKLPDTVDKDKMTHHGWCPPTNAWYDELADDRKKIGLE